MLLKSGAKIVNSTLALLHNDGIRLGFTGTHLGMTEPQAVKVEEIIAGAYWSYFHHGDCIGADAEAHDLVRKRRINTKIVCHPPENPRSRAFKRCEIYLPERPYLDRNQDIVDAVNILLGCPASPYHVLRSGTWATLRYAAKRRRPFVIVTPAGLLLTGLPKLVEQEKP